MDQINYIPNVITGIRSVPNIQVNGTGIRFIRPLNTGIRPIRVNTIADARVWMQTPPQAIPMEVPVTQKIGTPIVNMPGCVKVNKENAKNPPNKNNQLVNDDPKQNVVLCDAGMPYYEPPNYDYRELTWQTVNTNEEEVDEGVPIEPEAPNLDTPEPPNTPPTTAEDPPCPPANARRIGDLNQAGTEKVTGYELKRDPNNRDLKICVTQWEDIGFVEQYLPSASVVTTTAGIAAVATTSALLAKPLADLLLKVIKPAVKKILGKVQTLMGKKTRKPTLMEKRTDQYREKKGLLPMKRKN